MRCNFLFFIISDFPPTCYLNQTLMQNSMNSANAPNTITAKRIYEVITPRRMLLRSCFDNFTDSFFSFVLPNSSNAVLLMMERGIPSIFIFAMTRPSSIKSFSFFLFSYISSYSTLDYTDDMQHCAPLHIP